jgi:methylated-DNA-[protein]-cysteine S-methyltransferase
MTDIDALLRRFAPAVAPPVVPDDDVAYALHDAPVGQLVLAVDSLGTTITCSYDDEGTVAQRLAVAVSPRVLRAPRRLDDVRRELDEYFNGTRTSFSQPVDARLATPFARRVLSALAAVPYGQTTSYADIAAAIGSPGGSRAVGNALGANPVCLLLPCHRVVRADGSPGGYAGGEPAKRALLELEGSAA